jgi:ribosomal protein S18 acetylase RimI-like enzyme
MFNIRRATIDDVPLIAPLFNDYRVFYKQASDLNAAKKFLEERLLKNESVIFLAFNEDNAVGFTQLYPVFSSVSMKRAWILNDLFINASSRGKGAGVLLLEAAKQLGRETESKYLLLQTQDDNYTAQHLYNQNEWKRVNDFFYEFDLC